MKKITDKQRLDWLLDNRDLGVRGIEYGVTTWIDTRAELDAAMRAEVRLKRAESRERRSGK